MYQDLKVREDIVKLFKPNSICIELGVAEGNFSKALLENSQNIEHLYSVDKWAGDRSHNDDEYKRAIKNLENFKQRNSILKLTFDAALDLFPDNFFDFIYVDGYAHTGEDNGKTFFDWWPKLKENGIFAGDDYDANKWRKVYDNVNKFCNEMNVEVNVINNTKQDRDIRKIKTIGTLNWFPTWYTYKNTNKVELNLKKYDVFNTMSQNFKDRKDIVKLLKPNSICIELGVAEGNFSKTLLENSQNIEHLYSVDKWDERSHNTSEYKRAIKNLENFKQRNSILKLTFEEALDLFPDNFFDFIYVDGHSHNGQENGKTFKDWWPKLKKNGIIAGDNYDKNKWVKVFDNVNNFGNERNLEIMQNGLPEGPRIWYFVKNNKEEKYPEIAKFENIHRGETCVLMGLMIDEYVPLENVIHISCNSFGTQSFCTDKNLISDYHFVSDNPPAHRDPIKTFAYAPSNAKFYGRFEHKVNWGPIPIKQKEIDESGVPYIVYENEDWRWGGNINRVREWKEWKVDLANNPFGGTSTTVLKMFQFALYCGFSEIIIVGCDCTGKSKGMIHNWKIAKEFAQKEYPNVKILSIKPVGLKGVFDEYYSSPKHLDLCEWKNHKPKFIKKSDPWPHVLVENILPNDLLNKQIALFSENFDKYTNYKNRYGIDTNDEFMEYLNSLIPPIMSQVEEQLRFRNLSLDPAQYYWNEVKLAKDVVGYSMIPHCDIPAKCITMIIYINGKGSGTTLIDENKMEFTNKPVPNSAFIFVPIAGKSYHKVDKTSEERHTIQCFLHLKS